MKTKKTFISLIAFLLLTTLCTLSAAPAIIDAANSNYVSNRSPLVTTPFVGLPLGTIKANGWLLKQLELQRDGLTGHAEEIYSELGANSAWLGGNAASSDWERPPYYVRGLIDLAYTLNDTNLKTKAQKWMDWAINSQQTSGYFGPSSNSDWWARMPMLCAIRDYYEATNDSRVLNFLTKYFQYQNNNTPTDLGYWGKARVSDNIDSVLWLYNRTGDSFLMTLADKLRNLSHDWSTGFNNNSLPDTHGVNVAEGYKFPAVWWQRSNSSNDRTGYANGHNNIIIAHGMPHQVYSCTEALAGKGSIQGTEQCTMVERIWSDGLSARIFGDAAIGDNLEKVAFNALPASLSKTSRQQQYYTVINQAQSKYSTKGYAQDYANGILPSWLSGYPCCCFNWHMGWPRFTMYSWTATDDNGLAIMAYAPTEVNAKVGSGVTVKFVEDTKYPFEQQIRLTFTSSQSVQFPLKLRIPAWCASPSVKVNGVTQSGVTAGTFYTINRTWNNNDTVTIDFPMTIKAVNQFKGSVSIERGPLVYSLKLNETWTQRVAKTVAGLDFGEYEITPSVSWNYGLVVDRSNPGANMTVNTGTMPVNPFEQVTTPITITAKARKLTTWTMAANLLPNEVPSSPLNSGSSEENVTLVPFGAENIRITYFPVVETYSTTRYEAESATVNNAQVRSSGNASNGQFVGGIDFSDSYVQFAVNVPSAGTYKMTIGYANGWSSNSTHNLSVNGGGATAVTYPRTGAWAVFSVIEVNVNLNAGNNTIRLSKATNYAELDYINLTSSSATPTPTPTPGATATPTPTPAAFLDNFDDGNANGWTTYGGTWSVSGGWYTVASNPGAKSLANGTNYGNFTYQADVQISTTGSNNNAGLIFRVTNPSTGADAYNGYYVGLQNNRIMLGRASGAWTELASYTMTISLNTTYHVKVVANGSNIKFYVTDMTTPKIDYNDSTWTAGAIGVRTYSCGAKFDNISVTAL